MDPDTETAAEVRKLRRTIVAIVAVVVVLAGGYVAVDAVQDQRADEADEYIECVDNAIAHGRDGRYCD